MSDASDAVSGPVGQQRKGNKQAKLKTLVVKQLVLDPRMPLTLLHYLSGSHP